MLTEFREHPTRALAWRRTIWRALSEKVCSADPLSTILFLEEVGLSDALDRPETTSINPTTKTMIRPGATITTNNGTRSPIDPSLRSAHPDEANPGRDQHRPRDGTKPIWLDSGEVPDGTKPIWLDSGEVPDGTNPIWPDPGAVPDGTNPISPHSSSDHATERSQILGPPTRRDLVGTRQRVCQPRL
jgi:hypothetical protein